jgi:hypothetical protein
VRYTITIQNVSDDADPPNVIADAEMEFTYSGILLPDGLAAYYPFDGDTQDYSGNGNHGMCTSCPSPTADRWGRANSAYSFDGVDNFISAENSASLSELAALSLSVWYQPLGDPGADGGRIAGKDRGSSGNDYGLIHNESLGGKTHYVRLFLNTDGDDASADTASNSVSPGSGWHHIVGVWTGDSGTIYLDGSQISSDPSTGNLTTSAQSFTMGGMELSDTRRVHADIDEIRLYNRALTPDEVTTLFGEELPTPRCDDGDLCNGEEMWAAGACLSGPPLDCDDLDERTADSCDAVSGCVHAPIPVPELRPIALQLAALSSIGSLARRWRSRGAI